MNENGLHYLCDSIRFKGALVLPVRRHGRLGATRNLLIRNENLRAGFVLHRAVCGVARPATVDAFFTSDGVRFRHGGRGGGRLF